MSALEPLTTAQTAAQSVERMRNLLAFLLVGAFIVCLPALFIKAIPDANKDIVTYMVGQLSGMALTVIGFYFINKVGQDAVDAKRVETTGKMAEAVIAAANAGSTTTAADGAGKVAEAAIDKAAEIRKEVLP